MRIAKILCLMTWTRLSFSTLLLSTRSLKSETLSRRMTRCSVLFPSSMILTKSLSWFNTRRALVAALRRRVMRVRATRRSKSSRASVVSKTTWSSLPPGVFSTALLRVLWCYFASFLPSFTPTSRHLDMTWTEDPSTRRKVNSLTLSWDTLTWPRASSRAYSWSTWW